MFYEKIKDLPAADFKRYCGVEKTIFDKICEILADTQTRQRLVSGRPPKLSVPDQNY